MESSSKPITERRPRTGSESLYFDQLLNKIKHFVNENGVMLEDFFHEYDPLRKGYVSSADFKKVIGDVFKEMLTNEDIKLIQSHYFNDDDTAYCNWPKFLHDAESAICINEPHDKLLAVDRTDVIGQVAELAKGKIDFISLLAQAESLNLESKNGESNEHVFCRQTEDLFHNLEGIIEEYLLMTLKKAYAGEKGFDYLEFLRNMQELEHIDEAEIPSLQKPPAFCIDIQDGHSYQVPSTSNNHTRQRWVISYEALVWITFVVLTILCIVDRFIMKGDVVLERPGKRPERIWGTNIGETITNVIWGVTARLIITSQNLMFYTMMWCLPNLICEIAPRWIKTEGIRDINAKIHTFAGIFLIGIPSVAHVLVIFLPPLFDGTGLTYYPGPLNWTVFWDPAAVPGWTFNDYTGVHLTSDEIYRFVLMIVLFCFLFPLSRSNFANQRSYSLAMALHVFAGIWYAIDNIRKCTHGLAHFVNLPVLIFWCLDRVLSIWVYRRQCGRIVRKDVIGNNEYVMVYIKLDKDVDHAIGDVYYLLHQIESKKAIPQRSHPFTTFANLSHDSTWDVGFVISIIGAQKQLCVPWTSWLAADDKTVKFHTWGPYRSSVWNLDTQLLNLSNEDPSYSKFILFATGSGCGYVLDVLSTLAYNSPNQKRNSRKPTKIDIYYSVRCKEFYHYLKKPISKLLQMILENNSAVVNFNFYVTDQTGHLTENDVSERHVQLINGRIDFEKVLKSADSKTCCYFVGRPQIAKTIEEICKRTGVSLVKDYTNGRGKNNDRALLIKYLRTCFWVTLFIVGICVVAGTVVDIRSIKELLEMNGLGPNKTDTTAYRY